MPSKPDLAVRVRKQVPGKAGAAQHHAFCGQGQIKGKNWGFQALLPTAPF